MKKKTKMENFVNDHSEPSSSDNETESHSKWLEMIMSLIINLTMNLKRHLRNLIMRLTMNSLLINLRIKIVF